MGHWLKQPWQSSCQSFCTFLPMMTWVIFPIRLLGLPLVMLPPLNFWKFPRLIGIQIPLKLRSPQTSFVTQERVQHSSVPENSQLSHETLTIARFFATSSSSPEEDRLIISSRVTIIGLKMNNVNSHHYYYGTHTTFYFHHIEYTRIT